jgi:hypothetical protein
MLLAKGRKVRALVRREDERAEALRQLGAGRGEWVVALYCRLSRMVCTRVVAFC